MSILCFPLKTCCIFWHTRHHCLLRVSIPALSLVEASPGGVADSATVGGGGTAGGARGAIGARELAYYCGPHDLKRLGLYSRNLVDYHLITDLLPMLSKLYFLGRCVYMYVDGVRG